MRIAGIAVGNEPVLDGEGVAADMQHGKSSVGPAQRHASPSADTSKSGRGVVSAHAAATSISGTPPSRNGVRNKHSSSKPAVQSKSGPVPKTEMAPTAPGRCATHSTTPIIQPMPSPISRQNTASKPSGSVSTPRMPIGMTQTETTGIASSIGQHAVGGHAMEVVGGVRQGGEPGDHRGKGDGRDLAPTPQRQAGAQPDAVPASRQRQPILIAAIKASVAANDSWKLGVNTACGAKVRTTKAAILTVRNVSVGRSTITPVSTMATMMKARWVAVPAPEEHQIKAAARTRSPPPIS